jgi:hypothetical protein
MEIRVKIKNVFGVTRIYPTCEKAELFCKIAGTLTLMPKVIEYIKDLGYAIKVDQEVLEL